MPKICRSMLADGDKPQIGNGSKMLGVRMAPDPNPDILADAKGKVSPQTGGMSVAPEWQKLPHHLIPKRFRDLFPRASGSNHLVLWTMGTGPFLTGPLTKDLDFRQDPGNLVTHGFVEPPQEMSADEFQNALAATQDQWVKDEG